MSVDDKGLVRRRSAGWWALALSAMIACTGRPPATPPIETAPPTRNWVQVWGDEFDGPAGARISSDNWVYDIGDGCAQGNCGWGNNEKEYYSNLPSNISLNGQGQLMIVARASAPGLRCYYGACRYTSGKITTRGKVVVEPGRVEARIKLAVGQGLWPAFWLLGSTCPETPWPACGEIDIMENKGSQPTSTSSALHGPGYSGATPFVHVNKLSSGNITDFHTYAVEWDSTHVRFFVDDALHYQITRDQVERYGKSVLGNSFHLILNLAVGGHFDGDPQSDQIFPATMVVDYVRVYRPAS